MGRGPAILTLTTRLGPLEPLEATGGAGETRETVEGSLVRAAVGGDTAAFAALYDRHLDRVYRHLYYRVGNQADAEDLTQQVFLQAWRTVGSYRQTGAPFVAWLLTIAHNLVVSRYRRTSRAGGEAQPLEDARLVASEGAGEDPEAEALASDDRASVRRAILRLKEEQQHVVLLRFVEGFTSAEVAAVLGKSEGNVRVIQHRALTLLRQLLVDEELDR